MRRALSIIALLATLVVSAPAEAGMRVVYDDPGKTKQLRIEVADNGDARIADSASADYGLLVGSEFYVVSIEGGKPTVARLKDVAAAIDQLLPPIFKGLFEKSGEGMKGRAIRIEPGRIDSIAGRTGRIYVVRGLDDSDPEKPTEFLISQDADLKPVGAALEAFMNAAIVPMAPLIRDAAVELIEETRAIFALGTPIDAGGRFKLISAEPASFPDVYFRLPAKPQSVKELVAAMKNSAKTGGQ